MGQGGTVAIPVGDSKTAPDVADWHRAPQAAPAGAGGGAAARGGPAQQSPGRKARGPARRARGGCARSPQASSEAVSRPKP